MLDMGKKWHAEWVATYFRICTHRGICVLYCGGDVIRSRTSNIVSGKWKATNKAMSRDVAYT